MTVFHPSPIVMVRSFSSIQKKIIRAFNFLRFKIENSSNNKIANFLVVTLTFSDNFYRLFPKINKYPSHINVNSNRPSSIIKQVPKAVNTRIRRLSRKKISMKVLKCILNPSGIMVLKKNLLISS